MTTIRYYTEPVIPNKLDIEDVTISFEEEFPSLCKISSVKAFQKEQIGVALNDAEEGEYVDFDNRDIFYHISHIESCCLDKQKVREVLKKAKEIYDINKFKDQVNTGNIFEVLHDGKNVCKFIENELKL